MAKKTKITAPKPSKIWQERFENEQPLVLNMSFEEAVTKALNTPLPKKEKKKK